MKFAQFVVAFAILASVLSVNSFAKDNHSGKFTLTDPVRVGSTELAPGRYKAEWSGPADAVKIEILQNGKTVATVPGQNQESSASCALRLGSDEDGERHQNAR